MNSFHVKGDHFSLAFIVITNLQILEKFMKLYNCNPTFYYCSWIIIILYLHNIIFSGFLRVFKLSVSIIIS